MHVVPKSGAKMTAYCIVSYSPVKAEVLPLGANPGVVHFPGTNSNMVSCRMERNVPR